MDAQLFTQIIIVALVVVCFIGWIAWQIKKKGLREFAIDVILEAEEKFEKGQNSEKMEHAINAIKAILETSALGRMLSAFITDDTIEMFIQGVFDGIKKALDYTPNNG